MSNLYIFIGCIITLGMLYLKFIVSPQLELAESKSTIDKQNVIIQVKDHTNTIDKYEVKQETIKSIPIKKEIQHVEINSSLGKHTYIIK